MGNGIGVKIDLRELSALAKAIRAAEPETARLIGVELQKAGDFVADVARAEIRKVPSISPTVKVRKSGFNIFIVAGDGKAPAGAFEHDGVPGEFWRPVFGNRHPGAKQKAHPFVWPNVERNMARIVDGAMNALDVVFARLGFR